ncbi:MAG: hypothetical protein E7627_06895 [Ruminococcaceae bacterium]|nr:hypothetical protein [Oscillospiraceae bacterium]
MKISSVVLFVIMVIILAVGVCADTIVIGPEPTVEPSLPLGLSLDALVFFVSMICTSIVALLALVVITARIKKNRK